MAKTIKISLLKSKVSVVAELKENKAPETCCAFWDILPVKGKATHARWGGNEIWTSLPSLKTYKAENETIFPAPGEILIVPVAPNAFDLAIWYGKGWCFGPTGFVPGNHVATVTDENSSRFAEACEKILSEGREDIIIEKNKP